MSQNIGTLLGSAIRPASTLDVFPSFHANEGLGGFYSVADITERNAITFLRRIEGMRIRVISETKDYELIGGVTNADWVEILQGNDVLEGVFISSTLFNDLLNITYVPASNKIYIDTTSNITYRWNGTNYIPIGSSLELGETPLTAYRGDRGKIAFDHSQIIVGNPHNTTAAQVGAYNFQEIDNKLDFTTQIISTGGNYNNLEITANLVVFTNENAQAIINGVRGRKDFHILNLSNTHEVRINHNSPSVSGAATGIMLPTNSGNMGIRGTARILFTQGYGYYLSDAWSTTYRPEFRGLLEERAMTVNENSVAKTKRILELKTFRDAQSTPLSLADLDLHYPESLRGFEVYCTQINKTYIKVANSPSKWISVNQTVVL